MNKRTVNEIFLFDNGSFRPDSTRSLRLVAGRLAARLGRPVQAVSLLHSTRVAAADLDGEPARLLEPALGDFFAHHPEGEAVLLPLFFGPSAALTEYVPARVAAVRAKYPRGRVQLCPWLVGEDKQDRRLAQILADEVRQVVRTMGWAQPQVVLVDHGSPQAAVAVVRDRLGAELAELLGTEVAGCRVASMERREGEAYAFNEPLLARCLRELAGGREAASGGGGVGEEGGAAVESVAVVEVVVALQFLSPGRHAGPGGDIATICAEAEAERPGLRTRMSEPIAHDGRLIELLAERLAQAQPL